MTEYAWIDANGETRLKGTPSPAITGGVPSGAGSPLGSVTPASGIGSLYVDTTSGGLYIAVGATSADWLIVGGGSASTPDVPGVTNAFYPLTAATLAGSTGGGQAVLSDIDAQQGSGNGIYWNPGAGADGAQTATVQTGTSGHGLTTVLADANGNFKPGNTIDVSGLPTANPGPNLLWNNAGSLAIGT